MRKIFKITGMHCESCAKVIEMELEGKVKSLSINQKTGKATIEFDEKIISAKQITEIITKQGYGVS